MQQGNFINVFLAVNVSDTYDHHQEQWMLSCRICAATQHLMLLMLVVCTRNM